MATNTERFGFTLPSGQDPASIIPLNLNTQNIEKYLGMTQDMLAPLYDATEGTYEVDDIVTHDSVLYKCITAVETPEAFDETKWVETTAVQEGGGGGSGASAIEKTQAEYDALTPAQKTNGSIYMVQGEVGEEKDLTERMSDYISSSGTVSAYNSKNANFLAWHALASEDSFDASVNGEYWAGNGDGAYLQFDFTKPVIISKIGFASYLASNFKIMYSTDGNEYIYAQNVTREAQSGYICTKTITTLDSPIRDCVSIRLICDGAEYNVGALHFYGYDSVELVNKIYYMGTEYANTNGGSGGGSARLDATVLYDTPITANGTYTLADSYENYDFISIKAGNGTSECDIHTYAVDDLKRAISDSKVITNPNTGGWFNFTISANEITIPNKTVHTIYGVIGYKIVGGGSGSSEAEDINYDNTTSQLTADNVQDAIDEVVANADTASEDILTLQNVQGYDAYDETQTYAVGDYAIYNNHVYECTTAVSTAEPFDSTKWSQTSIEQIIDGVKGDVSQLNSSLNNLIRQGSVTNTSDNNGNVMVNLSGVNIKVILFAWDGLRIYIPFYYNGNWYCRVQTTAATSQAVINTNLTFQFYYIRG